MNTSCVIPLPSENPLPCPYFLPKYPSPISGVISILKHHMEQFAQLMTELNMAKKSDDKVQYTLQYLKNAPKTDIPWSCQLLWGYSLPKTLTHSQLLLFTAHYTNTPEWLIHASYSYSQNMAETCAFIIPNNPQKSTLSLNDVMILIQSITAEHEPQIAVYNLWNQLNTPSILLVNHLLLGRLKSPISSKELLSALALWKQLDLFDISVHFYHQLNKKPIDFNMVNANIQTLNSPPKPTPFRPITPITPDKIATVCRDPFNHVYEWAWNGIRTQLIVQKQHLWLWSLDQELLNNSFPNVCANSLNLPKGCCLEGIILQHKSDKTYVFVAYDLLELAFTPITNKPFEVRRSHLEQLFETHIINNPIITLSPLMTFHHDQDLFTAMRSSPPHHTNGVMIKHKKSTYLPTADMDWLCLKRPLLRLYAVLLYVKKNRDSSQETGLTFGVKNQDEWVTIATINGHLPESEQKEIQQFVRLNTLERFGPVRKIKEKLVFEIGFESVHLSKRHKSGFTIHNPVILGWMKDKTPEEADLFDTLSERHLRMNQEPSA
jgi:DNA ligase 1